MKVQDVKKGMRTPWYLVVSDAEIVPDPEGGSMVRLLAQYPDAGTEARYFDVGHELLIEAE